MSDTICTWRRAHPHRGGTDRVPIMTSTDEAAVGTKLHQPVYDGVQLLLPKGKVLNSADIDFLRSRCPGSTLYIEDPILDELVAFEDDAHDREIAQKTQRTLVNLMTGVQQQYTSRMTTQSIDCQGIQEAIEGVLNFLRDNPVMAMTLVEPKEGDDYLSAHAAHVFYLSLVVGDAVRVRVAQARKDSTPRFGFRDAADVNLTPMALAALLMDIGMLPMKELFDQEEPLTLEQCEQVRNHPIISAAALPDSAPELIKLIIETHHENFDGTGYPYGLKGEELHIFSRILRIADAYAAATSEQVYKEACSPVRALWEMTWGPFSQFYDPIILKIFSTLIQPFPIGAKLKLNSGRYGIIVRHQRRTPFLPNIIIAFDEDGSRLPKSELVGPIKLGEHPTLKIISFRGEDLTDLYDVDTTIPAVTPAEFTTLFEGMYTGRSTTPGL